MINMSGNLWNRLRNACHWNLFGQITATEYWRCLKRTASRLGTSSKSSQTLTNIPQRAEPSATHYGNLPGSLLAPHSISQISFKVRNHAERTVGSRSNCFRIVWRWPLTRSPHSSRLRHSYLLLKKEGEASKTMAHVLPAALGILRFEKYRKIARKPAQIQKHTNNYIWQEQKMKKT